MTRHVNDSFNNTKLVGMLISLEKEEISSCKKFLQSPYFNASKDLYKLFLLLVKRLDQNKTLSKRYVWDKLTTKKEAYNDVRFRKYCSDLSKLMEQFFAIENFKKNTLDQKIHLLKGINDKKEKPQKLIESTIRSTQVTLENSIYKDTRYYYHQFALEKVFYEIYDFETNRGEKSNADKISSNLDIFYFGEKLRIMCQVLSQKTMKKYDYQIDISEQILQEVQKNETLRSTPLIKIYYQTYKMLTDFEDENQYFKLKTLIQEYSYLFPKSIAVNDFYAHAQNYCARKLNKGEPKYLRELFDIYNLLIKNDLIVEDGEISPWYFRNFVVVGLRLGEYNWVESFIDDYKIYLPDSARENAVSYNQAQLYFYQKKYNKVLQQLLYVEYDDLSYNLNSKTILIATYYELDEIELLTSHLDTFYTFLNRRKDFPEERRKIYKNLIKYTRRLIKTLRRDKKAIAKLREEITLHAKNIANSGWLLEKLDELK